MKQDPPSFESTMSVDETDPAGPSSFKSGSPLVGEEVQMSQVDAAVVASRSLMEDDDDDDEEEDDISAKSGASEQRDPPHNMGGFGCQPYDPQEWESIYNATVCTGVFPVCNVELAEQLEMMTVSFFQEIKYSTKMCKFGMGNLF
jgi:hypothetical protein